MLRIASSLAVLALAGCSSLPETRIITPPAINGVTLLPRPAAPVLAPAPQVIVVTKENVAEVLAHNPTLVAMTPEEFEQLLENQQKVLVFVANQNTIIAGYEEQAKQ